MEIKWVGSPNFDIIRKPVKKIVIHWMAGTLAGTDKVFQDTTRGTSAHFGIENTTIHQYVDTDHVAYHADVYSVNQDTIGIEHSAAPDNPATEETYKTSAELIRYLCNKYSIPLDRQHIIKHSEVKATACPGTIDLDKLITLAKGEDMTEVEKLRKEADDARKARDENWNLYQAEKTTLNQRTEEVNLLNNEISVLKIQINELTNNPINKEMGALEHITLALKSALAGKWN